jgi:hypothetical protein
MSFSQADNSSGYHNNDENTVPSSGPDLEDTSTHHFEDATEVPGGAAPRTRDLLHEYLTRQHEALTACYRDHRLSRSTVKNSWDRLRRYHQAYHKARWEYDQAVDPVTAQYAFPSSDDRMKTLRQAMTEARDEVEQQFTEARDQEVALKLIEERLERRQNRFMDAAGRFMARANMDDDDVAETGSEYGVPPRSERSVTSEQRSPLLERFYERARDVKGLQQRLGDLQDSYNETRMSRDLKEDQGEELSVTASDFEADHSRKSALLQNELDLSIVQARELRRECQDAGLDIDTSRDDTTDDAAFTESSTRDDSQLKDGDTSISMPRTDEILGRYGGRLPQSRQKRVQVPMNYEQPRFDSMHELPGHPNVSGWVENQRTAVEEDPRRNDTTIEPAAMAMGDRSRSG